MLLTWLCCYVMIAFGPKLTIHNLPEWRRTDDYCLNRPRVRPAPQNLVLHRSSPRHQKHSGEEFEIKPYEADMRHLLNTYVQDVGNLSSLSLAEAIIETGIHDAISMNETIQLGDLSIFDHPQENQESSPLRSPSQRPRQPGRARRNPPRSRPRLRHLQTSLDTRTASHTRQTSPRNTPPIHRTRKPKPLGPPSPPDHRPPRNQNPSSLSTKNASP